jgi:hypothetical protein
MRDPVSENFNRVISQIVYVVEILLDNIKSIYFNRFGKRCECGSKLLGFKHCLSYRHDEDMIQIKRDKRLKQLLK